jgi:hypothetical protein
MISTHPSVRTDLIVMAGLDPAICARSSGQTEKRPDQWEKMAGSSPAMTVGRA